MKKKHRTIVQQHKATFETLRTAFAHNDVALMECEENGEKVAVICAINRHDDGDLEMVPFARFFNGNPYEILTPPTQQNENTETIQA